MQKCSDDFLKRLKFNKRGDESDEKENANENADANDEPVKKKDNSVGMDEVSFYGSELPRRPVRRPRPYSPEPEKRTTRRSKSVGMRKLGGKASAKAGHDVKKRPSAAPKRKITQEGSDDDHDSDWQEENAKPRQAKKRITINRRRKVKPDWGSDDSEPENENDESYVDDGDDKSGTGSSTSESESSDEEFLLRPKKSKAKAKFSKRRSDKKKGAGKGKATKKKEAKEEEEEPKKPEEGSLEYIRMESERAKQKMLAMLNMDDVVADIKPPPKPKPKPAPTKLKKEVQPTEIRRSSRLRHMDAPDYAKEKIASDTTIVEIEEKRNLDPVVLKDAARTPMDDYDENILNEKAFLVDIASPSNDVDDGDIKEFVGNMKELSMGEEQFMKVVPDRITALDIHVSADPTLVVAGDKKGCVGLWKIGSDFDAYAFRIHKQNVTGLKFNPWQPRKLVSTSYDAVVRMLDLEKEVFEVVYGSEDDQSYNSDMEFIDANTVLVSRGDGTVMLIDLRQRSDKPAAVHHCLDEALKNVSVHPRDSNCFAVGSRFGNGAFCDRRSTRSVSAASVAVASFNVYRAVSSVAFNASGSRLSVVSFADTISLYDTADFMSDNGRAKEVAKPNKVIAHNNTTGRWLTGLKAGWHPSREDCFLMGCLDTMRNIELWKSDGTLLHRFTSPEAPMTICSIVKFHPSKDMVFGANSSGKIFYFQ